MAKTTVTQRQKMYERYQSGKTYLDIAEFYGVSKECVRYWCRRQRDGGNCESKYPERSILASFDGKVRYCVLRLRLEHPRWGPNSILCRMKKRTSLRGLKLPSRAQIGRYLHQWEKFRRGPKLEVVQRELPKAATKVHQRWQLDFKVKIELADKQMVQLHTARDPVGEACIGAQVFPGKTVRVKSEEVQAFLRNCFARWGTLPDEIQTDGEVALVGRPGKKFFPTRFSLWLIGLGIQHRVIRSGKPTDNAAVERCHRTVNDYAIIGNETADQQTLNSILEQAVHEMNYELPSRAKGCMDKPPVEAHPELLEQPRPFQSELELACFDLGRIDAYLATITWKRLVGKTGQIAIGEQRRYSVGRKYAFQTILVKFDPTDRNFVFYLEQDEKKEIKRRPIRGLELHDLTNFSPWPKGLGTQQLPLPWSWPEEVNIKEQIEV